MIACVTFETIKITEPIKFYDVDKVHLIHYVKDPESEKGKVYQEFYDQVCKLIKKGSEDVAEIEEHVGKVSQFLPMLKLVLSIIEKELSLEEPVDLYVNISAGTSEYTAAAVIASMMNPMTIPFSVNTEHYMVENYDDVRNAYYNEDGVPVGLARTVFEPSLVPKYHMPMPDKNLIMGLKLLDMLNNSKRSVKGPDVIRSLKEKGLWRWYREGSVVLDDRGMPMAEKSDSVY